MILKDAGRKRADRGLTLIELLLSVALLLLFVGAIAFSFSSLQKNVQLDEGLSRLESLIGFARAHSAHSGRTVYLTLETVSDDPEKIDLEPDARFQLKWEPSPFEQPGVMTNLTAIPPSVEAVNDLVKAEVYVEPETVLEDSASLLMSGDEAEDTLAEAAFEASESDDAGTGAAETLATYAFFPDGSSDSAKLVVTARDPEDKRRFLVELIGLTGAVRRQELDENNHLILDENSLENSLTNDVFETNAAASTFDL